MTVSAANDNNVVNITSDVLATQALGELVAELAKQGTVSSDEATVSGLRWYPNKAGAIIIMRKRKLLATISPKKGRWSALYPSWIPVLTLLAQEKQVRGVSRLSHKGLGFGDVPE